MSLTERASLRKPEGTDPANIGTAVGNAVNDADQYVIPVYTDSATRDAANASPIQGQLCYVQGGTFGSGAGRSLQIWTGTRWGMLSHKLFARKTVGTSRALTTAVADDPELLVPLVANAAYVTYWNLFVTGDSAGDAKYQVSVPSGATNYLAQCGPGSTWGTSTFDGNLAFVGGGGIGPYILGTTDTTNYLMHTLVSFTYTGNTAGNLTLQWAQGTSSSNGTELRAGSYVVSQRLDDA